jgi:hypothetical protein
VKHTSNGSVAEMLAQHSNECRVDVNDSVPALRFHGHFLTLPDATSNYKSERNFLDFVVDGQSLWQTVGKHQDMVSVLCREFVLEQAVRSVNRLILREEANLPNDRCSFFICSECGDLGCGAITAVVTCERNFITWRVVGYQNNYVENVLLDDYRAVGAFIFDVVQYERTLRHGIERMKDWTRKWG